MKETKQPMTDFNNGVHAETRQVDNNHEWYLGAIVGGSNLGLHVPYEEGEYDPNAPLNNLTEKMTRGGEYLLRHGGPVTTVILFLVGDEEFHYKSSKIVEASRGGE